MSALLSVTFSDPFAEIAALNEDWPRALPSEEYGTLLGRARWAAAYWTAANYLYAVRDLDDQIMFVGPVMQNAGLACELTMKCLLFGGGRSDRKLKEISHSLSKLYDHIENHLNIHRFIDAVIRASAPLELPNEVADRIIQSGKTREEADLGWRVFSQHIRLLDDSYERPYRARYFNPGPIAVPEPFILLLGSLILLNAMNERLSLPLIGTASGEQL